MKDYELDNSPEEHKCTDNDVHDNYLQVPAFFDDNEHLYSQRVRKTINHVGIRTHKECTGSSSFVHPKHADHQKISFATSLNSQSQKRDLMLIKKYQDKISHLHEKNCQLRKENQELSESLKDEAERNSYLVNENNRLYYLQHSVENLSYSLRCKKVQVKDLSEQLSSMLEQMSRSENCISKFVKVVKDQDEIYTSSIKFHKDSEVVLQDYYNQKLTSCLQKYEELNNKDQVEQEIQTDSFYDEAVRECLNEHKQIQITKLENTEKLKSKYACLFQESVANLKESVKQCKTLEDKLRSKRRVSRNEKSALIQSYNSTFKSNHLQETFMIIFIFVSLGIQLIFKI